MSSTNPINTATALLKEATKAFNKENDVSRQVDKPIYPEDPDNDGPLTLNLRASEPCGAVQAGHTVIAVEDISHVVSSPTSLASYEPQPISLPQNIIDQPPTNFNSDNELLPDSDLDNNSLHSLDDPQLETITQITEDLGLIDPLTCYNKFLFYHRLPPLEHPQTIFTFLQYIRHDFPSYYSPDLIKISILNIKDHNHDYIEAHIYLPHETYPLPNHFIPPFSHLLNWFRYVPLKSKSSSPIPQKSYQHPGLPSPLNLSICTHNIRGFNQDLKRQVWEHYCLSNNLDIICLTETKLANNHLTSKSLKTQHYTYFWSCTDSSKAGTAIMVRNSLTPHIHKITSIPGYALLIDLFFKHDFKFRIISTYLPNDNTTLRLNTQNTIIQWLQEAHTLNLLPITLGDFNASTNNIHSNSIKYKLLQYLSYNNMYNLASHSNSSSPTWHSSRYSSEIDFIWAYHTILTYLTSFSTDDADSSSLSDHKILISRWSFPYAQHGQRRHKTRTRRRVFNYKIMSDIKWEEFSNQVNSNLNLNSTPSSTHTSESLETTWHKIHTSIITAALQHIPNKKYTVRNFQHIFSSKATHLHSNLKKLGNVIRHIKFALKHSSPIPFHLNSSITKINHSASLNIPLIPLTHQLLNPWITSANSEWKSLFHARNLENIKEIKQQINKAIDKRCSKLQTQPTSMINSILNRHKDPVKFNNIQLDNDIITDPPIIKSHILQHFDNWTAPRHINSDIFNSQWKTEYDPKPNINPNWYSNILLNFTEEEVLLTINQLPNNKACGPSGISYEMLKHAGSNFITTITSLFNRCLSSQSIPSQWKEGRIFPISKKPIFDGNLSNTRPISLVEHTRKLYTKLLTNRLNLALSQHNILSPFNFVALPGNSTSIPIHILNNIIEDSNCNSNQLWLLSQDMSKAYDSVNFELFQKSLQRIQMPPQLVLTLTNLLFDRTNRVITNLGLTNFYSVRNGIDQGETITPLFWRIYYDPLISYISSHFSGYTLSTSWQTSLIHTSPNYLNTSISVLAYMDDTLWIAQSKTQLEEITNIASSFYSMADIQVNPNKSVFITKQGSSNISFLNSSLQSIPPHQPFKFLGCWFTLNNKQTSQIKLIQEEAINLAETASTKKITDKQIIYIINTVIIPTIEYRIHNIVIPFSTCNQILSKYLTIAKHKAHLSRSTPNSTLLNHNLYNIHSIWDIQLQFHISNFLNRINNSSTLGTTTHIRLQQLQNNLWSTTNILSHPHPIIDGPNKHCTTFKIIQLLNYLQISIHSYSNSSWPKIINDSNTPLENILSNHPKYNTFKQQLRHKNILYLEQLCSADNNTLLDWSHLSPRLLHIPKGKKPLWFTYLENSILNNNTHRTIFPHLQPTGINPFAYQTNVFSKNDKPWVLTYLNNNIIIGQVRKTLSQSNKISITHWQHNIDTSTPYYYPLPPISCTPCQGCNLNSHRITSCCTLEVSTILSTHFLGRKKANKQLNLNANYIDLIRSTDIKHPSYIPPLPTINIIDSIISNIFHESEASKKLTHIALSNSTQHQFTFYTDGSVKQIGTVHCSMGIGWVQVYNSHAIQSFSAQISNWPSSYKAELIAVISAISTLPRNSLVEIFTDSQSIISKFNKLQSLSSHSSKLFKFNAWPIWHTLLNILKSFNIQLTFYKVQAHSNDLFNNFADLLANNHSTSPTLEFNYTNLYNPYSILFWNNTYIESPTRFFIKTIRKAHNTALWSSQQRTQEWLHFSHLIDWQASWLYFNNNQKISHNFTNFKLNYLKSFKIKFLLNILPTNFYFHSIYPSIFTSPNCFSCNSLDTSSHWYTCPSNTPLIQNINTAIHDIISNANLNLTPYQLNNLIYTISSHPSFNLLPSTLYPYSLHSTLKGLIPKPLIQSLNPFDISYSQASQLIIQILLKISDLTYNNIWIPYCTNFSHWKKACQIPTRLISNTPLHSSSLRNHRRNRTISPISCPCGFANHLHSESNTCPPLGQASLKMNIWSPMWIKHSISINHILSIQI